MQFKLNLEDVIAEMFENTIKHTPLAKDTALVVRVRFQLDAFDAEDDDDEGSNNLCKLFHVVYFSPHNYTKVMWRETDFRDYSCVGTYAVLADHDSCWRDSWSRIERRADEIKASFISPTYTNVNNYISVEHIGHIKISEFSPSSSARAYEIRTVDAADFTYSLVAVSKDTF